MILTCPNCATRYFLHDVLIGPGGRMVKCTSCKQSWRAHAEEEEPLALADEAPPPAPEPEPALADSLAALPADKLSQTFRARAQAQRQVREAAATGAIWAGLAAGLVLTLALAAVFRMEVVRLWPKTASAYAAVGMPVNTTGLIIEQVRAAPGLDDKGHPAVQVSGVMRNVWNRPATAPPLRVSLLGKDGRALARRLAPADEVAIKPGETRRFIVAMANPPQGAHDVEVTFALDAVARPSASAPSASAAKLRGPAAAAESARTPPPPVAHPAVLQPAAAHPAPVQGLKPVEAKPLPANSPYALPKPAGGSVG